MVVILPQFWVRPFCVLSSLWNQRSRVRFSGLTEHFGCCYLYSEHSHFFLKTTNFFLYIRDFGTMAIKTKTWWKIPIQTKSSLVKEHTAFLTFGIHDCYFQIFIEPAKLRKHLWFHVKRKTLIHFYLRHNYELTMDIDVNQIAVGHVEPTFII